MRVVSVLMAVLILTMSPASVQNDPSFVHAFSDGVWFIQWTDRDGTLAGQLQSVAVQPDLTLRSINQALSGARKGADVTLNVGGTLGGAPLGPVYTGRLRGSTLVLNISYPNGRVEAVVFQSGPVDDYNRAVAVLRKNVDKAIQERQRAAERAARQHAVVLANQDLQRSIFAVHSAIDELRRDADFSTILDEFARDWARMQRDYEQLRKDASEQPLTCAQLHGTVTGDLEGSLLGDLQGPLMGDDKGPFAGRRQIVADDVSRLFKMMDVTEQAFDIVQTAVKQNTLGTPGPAFTEAEVRAVVAAGYRQVDDANAAVKTAETKKDRILADAQALYKQAKDYVASLTCTQ